MKKAYFSQLILSIVALVVFNLLANQYFFRVDLTEEGRYSIAPSTKRMLRELKEDIVIKVYLEGDFPPGFQRLQKSIQETLEEFKVYAGRKLNYRFIDPARAKSQEEQNKSYKELVDKGIQPTNIFAKEGGKRVEKLIFPGATLSYFDKKSGQSYEISTMLFKVINQQVQGAPSPEQILNQSVENVEYNLISAIHKLTTTERKRVGLVTGHGELENIEMAGAITRLQEFYEVVRIPLPLESKVREGVDALIIAKPDSSFDEEEKYKLDQYLMKGGKALFFVDVVGVYMDSVVRDKGSFTFPIKHNLLDMFFKYGLRINPTLVKDMNAGAIPIVIGQLSGDQPNIQPIPWTYHPIVNTFGKHPALKSLGPIQTKFVSTIDTVKAEGIKKTPLLFSSRYTKIISTPTQVLYEEERQQPDPQQFNQGSQALAYLLEGSFKSIYQSRSFSKREGFVGQSPDTKILVCSDGDILRNEINSRGEPIPLGLDIFRNTSYANGDFLLNMVDYMLDDQEIYLSKNKEISLRPLDKIKLQNERDFWVQFNMIVPIAMVLIFAFGFHFWRKRRFSGKQKLKEGLES